MVCVESILTVSNFLQGLKIFWNWPIQTEKISHQKISEIETVLMCLKEIGLPEELENILIKFFGPALKILHLDLANPASIDISTSIDV